MMGMNVWKRATLAIVRKPVRSGIIGLLMLMVFTSLVAQVGVSTALQEMSDDIGRSMGIGFTVDTGENPASLKEASRFSRIPGVRKTVYERKTLAGVDGAHPVVPEHGPRLDSGLSTQVSVLGTTDSSLSEEFQSGLYRLEQGHHISGNGRNVRISHVRMDYRWDQHSSSVRKTAIPPFAWPESSLAMCRHRALCHRTHRRILSIRAFKWFPR